MAANEEVYSNIPIPDPSVLTTEALRRDIEALHQLIGARLNGSEALSGERLKTIERRFVETEARADKLALTAQHTVDTAFTSNKETFREFKSAVSVSIAALESKIADLKDLTTRETALRSGGIDNSARLALWAGVLITFGVAMFNLLHGFVH